ncbi:hypothetical protein H9Q69_000252 [Fusarium xylarioides]|nr:hypothetical protein H9Q69_000252 [Fusarium xylarioides]KAG5820555.1 hypothetical protein H9Q74_008824 [Fusarium xylarioides]
MITAFPDRRHPGQPSLLTHVSKAMQESPPATMGSMISLLLKSTARFVDAPTNSGLEENLFHIFEQGVAFRSQKDAECYSVFYKMQQMLRKLGENKGQSDQELRHGRVRTYIENEICDISNEVEHLCEIKDIKDELSMIQRVLESQLTVIGQYFAAQKQPDIDADEGPSEVEGPSPSYDEIKDLLTTRKELDSRMSKVKFLLADATSVEESVSKLVAQV